MYGSRERIINSAFDLFSQRGYIAVSTMDIAKRAEVNQSTLFRIFKSKEAIAKAVMEDKMNPDRDRSIAESFRKSCDIESVAKVAASYYAHAFNAKFVRFYIAMALELPAIAHMRTRDVNNAFSKFVDAQQSAKVIRDVNAVNASCMLSCAIFGLAFFKSFRLFSSKAAATSRDVSDFADVWLKGVLQNSERALASEEKNTLPSPAAHV